jgi:ankyrin repeat protein
MLQEVAPGEGGPRLVLGPIGGWDTGRFDLDRDLIEAIKKGHVAIVHAFLAKGASANARDARGGSALHWAAGRGKRDVVELLLAEGADVNARDGAGRTALGVAECRTLSEIADLLRRRGAQ